MKLSHGFGIFEVLVTLLIVSVGSVFLLKSIHQSNLDRFFLLKAQQDNTTLQASLEIPSPIRNNVDSATPFAFERDHENQ